MNGRLDRIQYLFLANITGQKQQPKKIVDLRSSSLYLQIPRATPYLTLPPAPNFWHILGPQHPPYQPLRSAALSLSLAPLSSLVWAVSISGHFYMLKVITNCNWRVWGKDKLHSESRTWP